MTINAVGSTMPQPQRPASTSRPVAQARPQVETAPAVTTPAAPQAASGSVNVRA
ncbi:hypothetical protein [Silvimonas soli]|uniref:hypothetical protein n=1 Tax=Silvimonas soli TaxID=2980100 RepID=UPI0024B3BE57|nr:hypothetical protein [Silvimonas soli]